MAIDLRATYKNKRFGIIPKCDLKNDKFVWFGYVAMLRLVKAFENQATLYQLLLAQA